MGTSASSTVASDRDGGIFRITLRRPPVNILDRDSLEALHQALVNAEGDTECKVILLEAEGRAFCAGVDVADHTADRVEGMITTFHRVVQGLLDSPHPVVAAVQGAALGGGMELVMASDVTLLRSDAKLGQPEIGLGVFPPAAAALLPRIVGRQRAADLILSGRSLSAREAHELGLGCQVLSEETFEEDVEAYVQRMAAHSGPVLRLTKRALATGQEAKPSTALQEADRLYLEELMELHDPHEGIAAFMEKRDPKWRNA